MRRPSILRLVLLLTGLSGGAGAAPLAAQTAAQTGAQTVRSDEIAAIAVTVYRDPYRGAGMIPAQGWPGGYALITETRRIAVPAGRSTIRFEGVSEGMMPETAIVTGLPRGVAEKNRDARLISPAALIDAYLKRRVSIRRTNRATGKVTVGDAIIQSGPDGGVLLTTGDGVEALGCSGLPESVRYAGIPGDLSARPTLTVTTDSPRAATVTVRLSYLAQGFDWTAAYIARIAADGRTLDLFAWLTLANGGSQGFERAETQAVAGRLDKQAGARLPNGRPPRLVLRCWPMDTTATHARWGIEPTGGDDIVVTANRNIAPMAMAMAAPPPPPPPPAPPAMVAQQEDLGDLKLYRIPEPVTIAALGRKQVAMIDRKRVPFDRVYRGLPIEPLGRYSDGQVRAFAPATVLLRTDNLVAKGLGLPLPAGGVTVFEPGRGGDLLAGEGRIEDRAIGNEVELAIGTSVPVQYRVVAMALAGTVRPYTVQVTNARDTPETFEIALPGKPSTSSASVIERRGRTYWRTIVPAHGEAVLQFSDDAAKR